jgi:hypothetical protein
MEDPSKSPLCLGMLIGYFQVVGMGGQNSERIARDFAHCDGADTAAMLILKLAETKKPLLRPDGLGSTVSHDL